MSNLTCNTFGWEVWICACDAKFPGQASQDNIPTSGQGPCSLPVRHPATEGTAFLSAVALRPLSHR